MSTNDDELYAKHLEWLRDEERKRTSLVMEKLDQMMAQFLGPQLTEEQKLQEKRDWFAGQALVGLCTAQSNEGEWRTSPQGTAEAAFAYADAMLAERSKADKP